ncbi:hypothetical protein BIV25_09455 [Streptomyces sp. MUSC 14]|uniref:hypothetical protein n=1 Tax=Streptomyces sp. MUSC 14 TaxID=1354889 RepID=UPI000923AEEF|nr:hypothetical protein [Streptomyces sp. MUSC 14]OIJ99247.1 hypothetical protein BIV25_09455 [Streptomyces sp. MUSC 14]
MPSTVGEAAGSTEVAAPCSTVFRGGSATAPEATNPATSRMSMCRAREVSPMVPGTSALAVFG